MKIVDVNLENLSEYPVSCFCKPNNEGYKIKERWLKDRFQEGLKVKVLIDESNNKIHGFLEYTQGEKAWRAVDARNYIFIHCLWITPNKYKNKGYGSDLINEAVNAAKDKLGVAVITSDDSFMASKDIFLKNNFQVVEENGKQQLLVLQLKNGNLPKFNDYNTQLKKYKGWNIVYSDQCPWVSRFIYELDNKLIENLNLQIFRLDSAKKAQKAPSIYAVFNLIKDGKILADHYISRTRFNNILKKEL